MAYRSRWRRQLRTSKPPGTDVAGYLESFRQRPADMLDRGASIRHGKTVAKDLGAGVRPPEAGQTGGGRILRLMAFCAPEAIPLAPVAAAPPGLAEQLGQEVARRGAAAGGPLAARTRSPPCPGTRCSPTPGAAWCRCIGWSRSLTADQMPAKLADQWRKAAAALIEAAIPGTLDSRRPGACSGGCCHTPRRSLRLPAVAWSGTPSALGNSGSYAAAESPAEGTRPHGSEMLGPSMRIP